MRASSTSLVSEDLLLLLALFKLCSLAEFYFKTPVKIAKEALDAYKGFVKQTAEVIQFLDIGRSNPGTRGLNIPQLKNVRPLCWSTGIKKYSSVTA